MSELAVLQREEAAKNDAKTLFGFWIYLMTDCVLFASLFATFMVLRGSTFGGPAGNELFSLNFVFIETMVLLLSSFTAGLGTLAVRRQDRSRTLLYFTITLLLGLTFLTMEITEFHKLYVEGNSWQRSGFLTAFFTLVGTHGLHITAGLIWMTTLLGQLLRKGWRESSLKRFLMLSLFWHFLDIIWIFIFTIVYLMGVAT
jgi:cytochrome o ubiquinol oxidase subunit 3